MLELMDLTDKVIGAAIRVHRALGPGFIESIYETALCVELRRRGLAFERQKSVPILFEGIEVGEHRLDLFIEGKLVAELKAIEALSPIHFSVVRSYLRAVNCADALLLNFARQTLDVRRVFLSPKPHPASSFPSCLPAERATCSEPSAGQAGGEATLRRC